MGVTHKPGHGLQRLHVALDQLKGVKGKVGWFESAKYADGTPVAYVATIQELGHGAIPPRPFMRPTVESRRQAWRDIAASGAKAVLKGTATGKAMMDMIGMQAAGDISKTISQITTPQLAPTTIELRRRARAGETITGKSVGAAHKAANSAFFQAGDAGAPENKPLVFTGILLATLTSAVEVKS